MSKVFEKLKTKGLLKPLPPKQGEVLAHVDKSFYYQFHQRYGHSTNRCTRLRHEIQDLIDNGKITDLEKSKPFTGKNPLPNHTNASSVRSIWMIGSSLMTEKVMRSFNNNVEIKEEEVEEEEEVTSSYRLLWDQNEDSGIDEWVGIIGGWIKPKEPKQKEEGESSCKPETELPELDNVQTNGWLDIEKDENLETEDERIAAINVWDSSDEEDRANVWDEETQEMVEFESDEEVAKNTKEKVHGLTRSGCHYQDKGREIEKEKGKDPMEEALEEDDLVLRQLKKTQAQASIWDLLSSFEKQRRTFVETLVNMKISTDVEADQLMSALMGPQKGEIVFTNEDLPMEEKGP